MASKLYTVSTIFQAIDRMSRPISIMKEKTSSFGKSLNTMTQKAIYFNQSLNNMNRAARDSFFKVGIAIAAVTGAMGLMLKKSADIETAIVKISTKLNGSMEKSTALVRQLQSLAANTPLTTMPVLDAADLLLAQGVKAVNLMKTITQLGDISQGRDGLFSSLVRGYSRIYSEDRITREHLDRFVFGGVPMYEALAKSMGLSIGEMSKEIERGNLGKGELLIAIEALTSETGAYNRAMEKQMQTLNGAIQQSGGWFNLALGSIGNIFNPFAKGIFQQSSEYFKKITDAFDIINTKKERKIIEPKRDKDGNIVYDKNGNAIMEQKIFQTNTVTFDRIYEKLGRLREAFLGFIPDIGTMVKNLESGDSFFYTFMDAITAVVEAVKSVVPLFKGFIKLIAILPQPVINSFAKGLVYLAMFGVVIAGILNVLFGLFGLFVRIFNFFPKLKFAIHFNFLALFTEKIPAAILSIAGVIKTVFLVALAGLKKAILVIAKVIGVSGIVIIGVILAIVEAVHILYEKWEWFRNIIDGFLAWLGKLGVLSKKIPIIGEEISNFIYHFITGLSAILKVGIPALMLIIVKSVVEMLFFIPKLFFQVMSNLFSGWKPAKNLFGEWAEGADHLPNLIQKEIEKMADIEVSKGDMGTLVLKVENNTDGKASVEVINNSLFESPNFQMGFNPLGNSRFMTMPTN